MARFVTAAVALVGALLLSGCSGTENGINEVFPSAAVNPELVSFGDVPVDYSSELWVDVINTGQVELNLSSFEIDDPFTLGDHDVVVPADDQITIPISFLPTNYTSYTGALSIGTDDPDHPSLTVLLTGTGVDAPTPDIDVDVLAIDFGAVSPGSVSPRWFILSNVGDSSLTVSAMDQAGSGAFQVVGDPTGFSVAAGASTTIVVSYAPVATTGDNGSLLIHSDDPDEPSTTVTFIGNGGGDFEYPVPIIDCPAQIAPRDTVTLDGSASYDPSENEPLTYTWTLVEVPEGSQATMSSTESATAYLASDIAGDYAVQLAVQNAIGVSSAPVTCSFEAIPEEDIHIELTWSTAAADLDLHLLTAGGALFVDPDDCNWCNQSPNWGEAGDADDPSLDIDDRQGYGPENTNIVDPADDTYQVKVHYFTDNGDTTTTATVKVYLYGVIAGEASASMTRDQVWDAGQISWPDGLYIEQNTANYEPTLRICE